ncbi:MAG: nuclear transport factor 2 family protein [Pyrinomonadaceae bacterium]|nr:nuclear transport factor 2 family protein [Pyrinomonadaceae bacterium]
MRIKFTSQLAIFIFLSACLIPAGTNIYGQEKASFDSDEAKLRHFKKVLWRKAYWDQDTKLLDRLLAKEFQFLRPDGGVTTKSDEMDYIRKNKPSYDSFIYTIERMDIFENGAAIISGKGHVKGKDEKGNYEYTYYSSNILIKRKGIWKAVGSHVSGYKRSYATEEK